MGTFFYFMGIMLYNHFMLALVPVKVNGSRQYDCAFTRTGGHLALCAISLILKWVGRHMATIYAMCSGGINF